MIQTKVVGSYPVPARLRVYNTRESLRNAMMVVLKTQELAGIDVVADGELSRWDIKHPETNGMIDYFVRPLQGVQAELSIDQLRTWRQKTGMAYRSLPAGIVTGPLGHGRLNLARDHALYSDLTSKPKKFTVTSPTCWPRPWTTPIAGASAPCSWPWPISSRHNSPRSTPRWSRSMRPT
jgi:5-methyltetrahydropteroyltriglutamate--homocysteine methyltransferase